MTPANIPLRLIPGTTFSDAVRFMLPSWTYKTIARIEPSAPVRLTVPGHGLAADWPVWINGVRNMPSLNRLRGAAVRPHIARFIDPDTLAINEEDATQARPAGGLLSYHPPVDFTGCRAVFRIWTKDSTVPVLELDSFDKGGLVIEGPGVITRRIEADAVLAFKTGVYALDVQFPDRTVTRLMEGQASAALTSNQMNLNPLVIAFSERGPSGGGAVELSKLAGNGLKVAEDNGLYVADPNSVITADLVACYITVRDL
jgi:hypothetical protein